MSIFTPIISPFRQRLATYFQRFFAKRAPRSDASILTLRNVYIFFSREGMLYALLLIITFILGVNYGNNLVLGLCFYLSSIWVVSLHLTFAHISGLKIRLRDIELAAVGEPIWVTLEVENDKSKPSRQLQFYFDDNSFNNKQTNNKMPQNSQQLTDLGLDNKQMLASIQGTVVVRLPVIANNRGRFELPRLIVSTVYPLGIMRAWSYVYFARPAWVYPKPIEFDWQQAQVTASEDDSEWSVHSRKGQNDFDTLEEYVAGESLARVSWAHVARGQGMLTKQFADNVGREQLLDYAHMPATDHDTKLAMLAYAVQKLGRAGEPFMMLLPNEKSHTSGKAHTQIGQGEAYAQACLLRLAKLP